MTRDATTWGWRLLHEPRCRRRWCVRRARWHGLCAKHWMEWRHGWGRYTDDVGGWMLP